MKEWEYTKITLGEPLHGHDDIDVLNQAGSAGWELIAILPNQVAYLKRSTAASCRPEAPDGKGEGTPPKVNGGSSHKRSSEAKVRYRNPKTEETWSGRGRMANWLKKKQDAGEDIENFRI